MISMNINFQWHFGTNLWQKQKTKKSYHQFFPKRLIKSLRVLKLIRVVSGLLTSIIFLNDYPIFHLK